MLKPKVKIKKPKELPDINVDRDFPADIQRHDDDSPPTVERPSDIAAEAPVLICPVCGDSDHHNLLNGVPFCPKCMVKLILKSNLPKLNRENRRARARASRRRQ